MHPDDPIYVSQAPPSTALGAMDVVGFVFFALIVGLYLLLVVYLAFVMYGMSQVALLFIVLLGSFVCPILLPVLMLILLSCGVIREHVRTRIAVNG